MTLPLITRACRMHDAKYLAKVWNKATNLRKIPTASTTPLTDISGSFSYTLASSLATFLGRIFVSCPYSEGVSLEEIDVNRGC